MAAAPARSERRRPRPGSLERPVSARMYRGTWLLVALPLLVAAFSVAHPAPLPAPPLPPAFDRNAATALATDLARSFPDRSPGSPQATGAVQWFEQQLQAYGFRTQVDRFSATIPGRGRVRLENLSTVAPGSSLDQGLDLAQGTSTYVYLGSRIVRGWAIELVLIAMLLPFFAATVDLFARCRRRRIPIAPALRSYLSRLGFWLLVGGLFELFALAGAWPGGARVPPSPASSVATHWPGAATLGLPVTCGAAWLVARDRLLPRRRIGAGEEVAGYTAALLALGVVSLLVVATNAFALVLLLPSLHVWLWLPQSRARSPWTRGALLLGGFAGPLLLLWSLGSRFGLGLHALWYLLQLTALGYVGLPALVISLAWAAAAAQLVALVAGRYAPYPAPGERPPRGPLRELVRKIVLARRAGVAHPRSCA